MICHKLKVRPEVSTHIYEFNQEVNRIFLQHESLPDKPAYWCVEETGNHSMITQCRPGRLTGKNIYPLQSTNWKWFCENVDGFEDFFKKYKLQNFFGSVLNRNFETHRHVSFNGRTMSSWTMAVINDYGTFNIVEAVDPNAVKYKDYGLQSDGEWLVFDELPDECELNIIEQNMTVPGELYVFDGWYYHQYFTGPNPRTTMLWADMVETEEQAFEFIKHMESL